MSTPKAIRVFIADDSAALLDGVFELVEDISGVKSIGFANAGGKAVASVSRLKRDMVLVDIQLPHGGGVEVQRSLKQDGRGPLTVVATIFPSPQCLKRVLYPRSDYSLANLTDVERNGGLMAQFTGALQLMGMN